MPSLAPLALCLSLAALAAGRPNNVRTQVEASQTGWTRGGASQVSQAQGRAAANSIGVTTGPGFNQRDQRAATAAVALQGGSAGNGDFSQVGTVSTETQGDLGNIGTLSRSASQGRANSAAITGVLGGGAAASQQVSQAGLLARGGRIIGRRGANLNLNTAGSVGSQAAVSGTGSFGNTNTVRTRAQHVGPLPGLGAAAGAGAGALGGAGVVFRGTGTPAFNNLQTTTRPPMMMMMAGRRGRRD